VNVNQSSNLIKKIGEKVFVEEEFLPKKFLTSRVIFLLTHYRPAMPFGNRKTYFRGIFSVQHCHNSNHPSGNREINILGVSEKLKIAHFSEKKPLSFS